MRNLLGNSRMMDVKDYLVPLTALHSTAHACPALALTCQPASRPSIGTLESCSAVVLSARLVLPFMSVQVFVSVCPAKPSAKQAGWRAGGLALREAGAASLVQHQPLIIHRASRGETLEILKPDLGATLPTFYSYNFY